jgi:DNA helicase HerA-like ATPase
LQGLVDSFSALGVPVFVSDVKGDLAGLAMAGSPTGKLHDIFTARAKQRSAMKDYSYADNPVVFWDLYGEQGHPIRTTISEMGPLLLSRILDLNETQEGVLNIAFRVADDEGMLLLNLEDLQAMLIWCAENRADRHQIWQCYQGVGWFNPAAIADA